MMKLSPTVIAALIVFCLGQSESHGQTSETGAFVNRLDDLGEAVRALDKQVAGLSTLLRAALPPSPITDIPPFELGR